jgi:hypothetical protein
VRSLPVQASIDAGEQFSMAFGVLKNWVDWFNDSLSHGISVTVNHDGVSWRILILHEAPIVSQENWQQNIFALVANLNFDV